MAHLNRILKRKHSRWGLYHEQVWEGENTRGSRVVTRKHVRGAGFDTSKRERGLWCPTTANHMEIGGKGCRQPPSPTHSITGAARSERMAGDLGYASGTIGLAGP